MMGTAIAAAHVRHGVPIVIHDANAVVLHGAIAAIEAELHDADAGPAAESVGRLPAVKGTVPFSSTNADQRRPTLRVGARSVPGRCPRKLGQSPLCVRPPSWPRRQVATWWWKRLWRPWRPSGNSIGNSSSIWPRTRSSPRTRQRFPLKILTENLADASRFCGMHFFHPVRQRPLVEVVRGPETSDLTIATVAAHVRRIERLPIVVWDGPGFVANRLLFPLLGEALELLREGVPPERIDQSAAEFGMAIGPLRLMDEIGLDTTLQAGWVLSTAFPERVAPSPLLVSLVKAGRLGRKTGAGFFSYREADHSPEQDAGDQALAEIIAPWITPTPQGPRASLAFRLVTPMLLEATRLLEEKKVRDPREIDLTVLFGLGFPAEKGGLLWWADTLGAEQIVRQMESPDAGRHQPTPLLRAMAQSGQGFYAGASGKGSSA